MTIIEEISINFLSVIIQNLWENRKDFKDELIDALDRALDNAGYENDSIRNRDLSNASEAFKRLVNPNSGQVVFSGDEKKIIEQFRIEITQNNLGEYILQIKIDSLQQEILKLQQRQEEIAKPHYFVELKAKLENQSKKGISHQLHFNDFKDGPYYRNSRYHTDIKNSLDENGCALIVGGPGSGKTALSYGIGYEFIERGNMVYYTQIRSGMINDGGELIKAIKFYNDPDALFIIDNAHLAKDEISVLVEGIYRIKSTILIVSRNLDDNFFTSAEANYIKGLKPYTVSIGVDENTIINIINRLSFRENIQTENVGNTKELRKKCEGDLHLLRYYIEAWQKTKDRSISDITEIEVLDNVFNEYLEGCDHMEELLKIAALSQYEILVESHWLGDSRSHINQYTLINEFNSNEEYGWGTHHWFIEYFHSTPAAYLIKAAAYKDYLNNRPEEEFIFDVIINYLESKPINFLDVFYKLNQNGGNKFQLKLIRNNNIYEWYEDYIKETKDSDLSSASALTGLLPFLIGVKKENGIKAEDLFQMAIHNIDLTTWKSYMEKAPLHKLTTISRLHQFDKGDFIQSLFLNLDYSIVGDRVAKEELRTANLVVVKYFILNIKSVGIPNKCVQNFSDGIIQSMINNSDNNDMNVIMLLSIDELRNHLDPHLLEKFWEIIDLKKLANNINGSNCSFKEIYEFLKFIINEVHINRVRILTNNLDFKSIGEKLRNEEENIGVIKYFIELLLQAEVDTHKIKDLCREGLTLKNYNQLLKLPEKFSKFALSTVPSLTAEEIENLILESTFRDISKFLSHFNPKNPVFKFSLPNGVNFQNIEFNNLLTKSSLTELSHFLFNFHFINKNEISHYFSEKIQGNTTRLLTLINNESLKAIDFFLWNWWMAYPQEKLPDFVQSSTFTKIVTNKDLINNEDKSRLLGIIGTLKLNGYIVPNLLTMKIDLHVSKQQCLKSLANQHIRPIRELGGLWAISENVLSCKEKEMCIKHLDKLNLLISIENQKKAINQLMKWLKK